MDTGHKSAKGIGGLALKGGRKESSWLCVLVPHEGPSHGQARWFLRDLLPIRDELEETPDQAILASVRRQDLSDLVVDFPLTHAPCQNCELACPGEMNCPVHGVVQARKRIQDLLELDQALLKDGPKAYENQRLVLEEIQHNRDVLKKDTDAPLLSKSFKRRLKKGILPYWNRPLDAWVWSQYYDQLLELFNVSYDSFGHAPLMVLSRMAYLKRHLVGSLKVHEANVYVTYVELLRAKAVAQKDLALLADYIQAPEARLDVLKRLDQTLDIFVYGQDMEMLIQNPAAFDAFILAVAGRQRVLNKHHQIPAWSGASDFIAPVF